MIDVDRHFLRRDAIFRVASFRLQSVTAAECAEQSQGQKDVYTGAGHRAVVMWCPSTANWQAQKNGMSERMFPVSERQH